MLVLKEVVIAEVAAGVAISVAISVATTVVANSLQGTNEASRLSDINPIKASFGENLPIVYGTAKLPGIIFWSMPLAEDVKNKQYRYKGTALVAACLAPDAGIFRINRIWANKKLEYYYLEPPTPGNERYTLRNGAVNQTVIPYIASIEGSNTPRFKNICYFHFQLSTITKYGNALPNFEIEVQSHATPPTLKFVLDDILSRANVPTGQISYVDTSFFTNQLVESAVFKNDGSTYRQFIEELQLLYNFTIRERQGFIEFAPTLSRTVVLLPLQKMGCQPDSQGTEENEVGSDGTTLYTKQEEFETDLPDSVQVEYHNLLDSFNKHTAIYRDSTKRQDNPKTIQFSNLRMDKSQAFNLAQRAFNYAYSSSKQYSGITLPYVIHNSSFQSGYNTADTSSIIPGNAYRLPLDSGSYNQLVTSVEITPGFIQNIASHDYVGGVGYTPQTIPGNYPNPELSTSTVEGKPIFIETSPLTPFVSTNQVDLLIGADNPPTGFNGGNASLGSTIITSVSSYTSKGILTSVLPATSHLISDETTTMNVSVSFPLATISTSDWLDAKQVLLVGDELILVREAVLVTPGNYQCKGLIRGWQGTEQLILDPAPINTKVYRVQYSGNAASNSMANGSGDATTIINQVNTLTLRGYDQDDSLPTTQGIVVQPTGRSLKPFAPVSIVATTDGAGSTLISWQRRARGYFGNSFVIPLNEQSESYRIDFYDASFTSIIASFNTTTESLSGVLTSFSNNGLIRVGITQISALYGDGFTTRATLVI